MAVWKYVGHRASETNPIRSIPLYRPAYLVLGLTDQQKGEGVLFVARRNVPLGEERYASACASLGQANRMRGPMRRFWQAKAFRAIQRRQGAATRRPQGPERR